MTAANNDPINCIQKSLSGRWLTSDHLETCILKLNQPSKDEYTNDGSRAGNLSILTNLLKPVEGATNSLLEQEFPNKPALVLAPELAFGSPDFESIDALVKAYNQNLIFICGFGFTDGSALVTLANKPNVEGIWNTAPSANKKYNGGWVWVKNNGSCQCYILIKNYFEQSAELTIPNLAAGDFILRLEFDDLVIFPLICADMVCTESNSPRERIEKSLDADCSSSKKILITGSLLNPNCASGHWKAALGDLLESLKASNARILLSNCINPSPVQDENQDKWRCLSGAFQHREGCKAPKAALPFMRYVDDTKFAGLVVRNTKIGSVFGKLKWTNNASEGLHAFSECSQHLWSDDKFQACDGNCAADELYRFILRNRGTILHSKITFNDATKILANIQLNKLLAELSPRSTSPLRRVAEKLFQKCLKGIKKDASYCPDHLHDEENSLDCAITTLTIIQHAINANLMPEMPQGKELEYGQLLSADQEHEILIWDSSEHTANYLYNKVKEDIVKDGGSARPLTIIGRGNGGGTPPEDGRIKSNRLGDISTAPSEGEIENVPVDKNICEPSDRVVFWKNQGRIDDILSSLNPNQDLINNLQQEVALPKEPG